MRWWHTSSAKTVRKGLTGKGTFWSLQNDTVKSQKELGEQCRQRGQPVHWLKAGGGEKRYPIGILKRPMWLEPDERGDGGRRNSEEVKQGLWQSRRTL